MVFGIDLGTTNSCIAMWDNGESKVVTNDAGDNTTPSCVAFTENGVLVGKSAVAQQCTNPTNTIYEAKRVIGQKMEFVDKQLKYLPFDLTYNDAQNRPRYTVKLENESKTFDAMDISAIVLQNIKETTERMVQQRVIL